MDQEDECRIQPMEEINLDSSSFTQSEGNVAEKDERGSETDLENEQQTGLDASEVHVLYLNVPPSDEPQVLDLSNILVHEGIQVIESDPGDAMPGNPHIQTGHDIVIGSDNVTEVAMITSQSEAQSAHALLGLSKSQTDDSQVQVTDILAVHRHIEHGVGEKQQNTSAEALLQLSSDQNVATYIMDETGTMIPISQMRPSNLLEVEDTGVTTFAICQCWCGREFISQEDLSRHKLAHKYQMQDRMTPGSYKCSLCLENFVSGKDLRAHHAENHPGSLPWECSICHRTFQKKIAMKTHMRVHNTVTRYQCSSCKKVFFYKNALNRHLKMHSCEKPFKCTICGDTYYSLWDLRKHRMNHQPPKLFACDICTKVFKQKQTLFVHSRIHTGQKPYSCEVCHRNFSLKSTLVQHQRIHTGEKPNVCHICERAFRQNSTLKAHLKTHSSLKPFMCRYCKMRFAYKDEVTEHEHGHAHNKTWQCEECGMWFKNQSLLARHSRVHTNERPFKCLICHKSFVQSGSLQSHIRSHTKDKPYKCRICSKAYYTSGTLLVHIRKFHNLDAKSVKEVFPMYNFIEDQKVFTIRNSLLADFKPIVSDGDGDESLGPDKTHTEDLLMKSNGLVEELVEMSGDIVVHDNGGGDVKAMPLAIEDSNAEIESVSLEAPNSVSLVHKDRNKIGAKHAVGKEVKQEISEDIKGATADSAVIEELCELHAEDTEPLGTEALQSSHAAHDRQEAALGLAELSLIGGEGMHLEKCPQTKTRTFFKEEEEDENDPNVTKIILSKEGGVMNSQDPHQCPVCGRIFGRKSIMIEHIRIHTDEKPYECDFCQACFRQNAQLRSHIRNNHTQEERYQCSFCHSRFLSRSITIRHISFHHKLKIKYYQNMNPAWTIDNAVWFDDNFELNVNNPQFVKMNKRKSNKEKGVSNSAATVGGNSDASHLEESAQLEGAHNKYVVNITLQPADRDSIQHVKACESVHADSSSKRNEHPSVHTMSSVLRNMSGQIIPSEKSEAPCTSGIDANTGQECTQSSEVASDSDDVRLTKPSADVKMVFETNGNSLLFCGVCAAQFRGVSSLRYHLRKVHKKTLDQSDLSCLNENNTQNVKHQLKSDTEVQTVSPSDEHSKEEVNVGKADESEGVKIVVYNDSKKCVNEHPNSNMAFVCLMCSQRFASKISFEEHLKSHSEEDVESVGLHRCDVCASVMKNTQQVTKHIIKVHGVKQIYICSICNREFFQQSSVYRHMKFLHKWEMKIRGEASIPVFVKPAPSSMHAPSNNASSVRVRKDSTSEDAKSPTAKQNSCTENVTYISLGAGDMDNLQIYKVDGQDIVFEIVDCDDNITTLKIKDNGSCTTQTEGNVSEDLTRSFRTSSNTEISVSANDEQLNSLQNGSSNDVKTMFDTFTVKTTTEPTEKENGNTKITTSAGSANSFIVVGEDKSKLSVTKELISHLVEALKNSSHENNAVHSVEMPQVIKVKNINTPTVSEPDTVNVECLNQSATVKNVQKSNQMVVPQKTNKTVTTRLPDPVNLNTPIIMSVKDIGAAYTTSETRLGHQNLPETGYVTSKVGNTSISALSVSNKVKKVVNDTPELPTLTRKKIDSGKTNPSFSSQRAKGSVADRGSTASISKRIKESVNTNKKEQTFSQSSETQIISKKAKIFAKTERISCTASVEKSQSKCGINESVDISMNTSDKTIKQESRHKSTTKQKTVKTSECSQDQVLSHHIPAEDEYITHVQVKAKVSQASVLEHASVDKLARKSASSCKKTSTLVNMGRSKKRSPSMKITEKSGKVEPAFVCHSSRGRVIKRKRFDDEI